MTRPLVAIDARYVRERPSGIGAMVQALLERVPALLPEVDFLLLTHPRAPRPLTTFAHVREVTVAAEANGPVTLLALPRVVDLSGVDLFHAPFNIRPVGLRCRTLTTVHDVMWLAEPQLCRSPGPWGWVETLFYGRGIWQALRGSTRLVAVSEATRQAIAALDPAAAARTEVIRHGLDPDFRPALSPAEHGAIAAARHRYAPGAARFVLTVGQAVPYKNHRRVVEAFAQAFRGDGATHLVLVQRLGHEARELLELARQGGVDGQVHIQPAVPFADLLALYRGALALCHPSLTEGWGMPVGEALGCGCPVVTSNRSAMPEVCGEACLTADPTDPAAIAAALRRLRDDERLRERLREAGLARARELRWDTAAQQHAALYRAMLSSPV